MTSLQGHLLIASPKLPDSNFYRTVVLIIQHDEGGAFGLILNRPTDSTAADVWEDLADSEDSPPEMIYLGGPVEGPLMALHTDAECSENEVLEGVHFATHKDSLERIVHDPATMVRLFTGYSGWAPGQLELELERGGWMTLAAREEHVFGDDDEAWQAASREFGRQITGPLVGTVGLPEDPSCN
jgi:putative transcriptional regulator